MNYLRVRNWEKFQHYKSQDGPPKWIKLHRSLLSDYEFCQLSELDQGRLVRLWLLAASLNNRLPNDPQWCAKQISAKTCDLDAFISRGFLEVLYEVSSPEQNREEKTREDKSSKDQRYVANELLIEKLLQALPDKDEHTKSVIVSIVSKRQLPDAALGLAIESAQGPGVFSPTRVAVSVLKAYGEEAA